jgi:DNA polymerase-3 subunit delta
MVSVMTLIHAFELLAEAPNDVPDVVALFGNDATLRSWVLQSLSAAGDVTQFDGEATRWSDLRDDLATASLFDLEGKRTIVVRGADKFVSEHRPEIEKYIAKPGTASRLILELDSLAANTRVYKNLLKDHLLIACGSSTDTKLGVTAASRRKFLTGYVAARHDTSLAKGAADALVEIMGEEIGMLDTEIAKLALYCDQGVTIGEELVRDIVAGWQGKTVWQITDAIAAGDAAEALRQLDKLMSGGQRPIALLPQIAWSLRRLGMATAVVEHRERSGRKWQLEEALSSAGVNRPSDAQRAKSQLTGLGRERARQLLPWLLDADLRLKGTHSADGRDRFLLEQFVMKLARSG